MKGLIKGVRLLYIYVFMFLVSFSWSESSTSQGVAIPPWVQTMVFNAKEKRESPTGIDVFYRMYDTQIFLQGSQTETFRHLVKEVINHEGLSHTANLNIDYAPQFEKLDWHFVRRIRNGNVQELLPQIEIVTVQREKDLELQMYDGYLTAHLVLPDIQVGDQIEYAYTVKGENQVFGELNSDSHYLGFQDSIDVFSLRYLYPSERKIAWKIQGDLEFPPAEKQKGEQIELRWVKKGLSSTFVEDFVPRQFTLYPFVQLSEYKNWGEVKKWANEFYRNEGELPEEWKSELANLKTLTSKEQVVAVLRKIQASIRYYGIELGESSHRPSPASEVLARKFGDCKDKSMLMIASLNYLGIKAYPALVYTGENGSLENFLPSPKNFNHVIVNLKIEGEDYWLDPTKAPQVGSLDLLGFSPFDFALVIGDESEGLSKIEAPKQYQAKVEKRDTFAISHFGGPVLLSSTTTFSGKLAEDQRNYFSNRTTKEVENEFQIYYTKMYGTAKIVEPILVEDDSVLNKVTLKEKYQLSHFWESDGEKTYYKFEQDGLEGYLLYPEQKERIYPLRVYHPFQADLQTLVQFPELKEESFTDESWMKLTGGVLFSYREKQMGNHLLLESKYKSSANQVEVEKVPAFLELQDQIYQAKVFNAWVYDWATQAHLVDSLLLYLDHQKSGSLK